MADTKIETLLPKDGYVLIGTGPLRAEIKNSFVRAFYGSADPSLGFAGSREEAARQVKNFHTEQEGDIALHWTHAVWVFNPIHVSVTVAVTQRD